MYIMSNERIIQLTSEIANLRKDLIAKETELSCLLHENKNETGKKHSNDLSCEEITRYSRQMLVPQIGVTGQKILKKSKVLIIGAGGLGCPASLYLAGAGIGEITLVDYDDVELSNLHRQILHSESDIDLPKVDSAYWKLQRINRSIKIIPLKLQIDSASIKKLFNDNNYNVVIDGSDNVATRYLLNDACVLNGIPLVSGSALQMEAQLTVFNYKGGPCYRCIFPKPPPPETVTSCGDGGVLGPVPGFIGVLQAMQTIEILIESPGVLSERLLLFDGLTSTFRNVKLRPKNKNCDVCGDNPSIKDLIDYELFCGSGANDKVKNIDILSESESVDVRSIFLKENLRNHIILDVRPEIQYEMCRLPNTYNFPFTELFTEKGLQQVEKLIGDKIAEGVSQVFVMCRRGNDSQRAVKYLNEKLNLSVKIYNVQNGLMAYTKYIDPNFPVF